MKRENNKIPHPTLARHHLVILLSSHIFPHSICPSQNSSSVGYKFTFFGRDAEVAASILRTYAYQSHSFLTTAVPVPALAKSVRRLVAAGHRVGVVRQVETAALKKSGATSGGKGGTFARAVTAVYTAATLECGGEEDIGAVLERGAEAAGSPGPSTTTPAAPTSARQAPPAHAPPASTYSLTIAGDATTGALGVAAVDAASGDALWAAFDGPDGGLETALRRLEPVELVAVQAGLPPSVDRALSLYAGDRPGTRLDDDNGAPSPDPAPAFAELASFFAAGPADPAAAAATTAALPPQAARALASALRRLRSAGLDGPLKALGPLAGLRRLEPDGRLALSGATLAALDVLSPSGGGVSAAPTSSSSPSSLLWLLDRTRTQGGRRALRDWVARPLADVGAIEARLGAVEELVRLYGGGSSGAPSPVSGGGGGPAAAPPPHNPLPLLAQALSRLPDLERGLARALHRTASPPEFVGTMKALAGVCVELGLRPEAGLTTTTAVRSPLLRRLLGEVADPAAVAAAAAALAPLDARAAAARPVDRVALLSDGDAFPRTAAAKGELATASAALDGLLPALRKEAGVPSLAYVSIHNQGSHLLELPVAARPPPAWVKVSGTKAKNRYQPPAVTRALAALDIARERLAACAGEEWKDHLVASVSPAYGALRSCAAAVAALDALLSLADTAAAEGWVRPEFLPVDAGLRTAADLAGAVHKPTLRLTGLVHPLLAAAASGGRHSAATTATPSTRAVPNDLALGGSDESAPRALVTTGPNMGGKSALARAAGLAVIMAHAGSFVPAASAALTPFDAVFTRMGASDDLLRGRSTFHEELADAAAILRDATPRSLAIIDELGRGTSTHDGAAIAGAVLDHLAGTGAAPPPSAPGALTLFITHYSDIARAAAGVPGIATGHMACLERAAGAGGGGVGGADADGAPASSSSVPHIIFLYRLVPGAASSSHGLNVGRLAGLPEPLIARAAGRAAVFQAEVGARVGVGGGAAGGLVLAARSAVAVIKGGAGVGEARALAVAALVGG